LSAADTRIAGVRSAIVHDWFQGFHGSERVVETMRAGLFAPDSRPDVFTFHAAHSLLPPELDAAIVKESRLASLPGVRQRGHDPGRWRWLLPYMPSYFERIELEGYDLVISSSHACAVNVRPPAGATHLCYCYTPMRYAWMPETDRERVRGVKGTALRLAARRLRRTDLRASRRPDAYVAISNAVRERIERFYGREAAVIHPPVDVDDFEPRASSGGHFLWVHRLVSYKRPELVAEAFRGLPHRLTMVGVGPLEPALKAMLPGNVELRGWVSRAELIELYAHASGFIHVAEEDFGITMVEALAAGTPVLALNRGGARDIVRDGIDGTLVEHPQVGAIRAGVERLASHEWDASNLRERASEFSRERFLERMSAVIADLRDRRATA